ALHHMGGRVDMGGVMHRGRNALRQYARLGHVVDAFDLDVLEIGPVRRLVPEPMGQVVELEPHRVLEVLLERYAADLLGHSSASLPDKPLHPPPSSPGLSRRSRLPQHRCALTTGTAGTRPTTTRRVLQPTRCVGA